MTIAEDTTNVVDLQDEDFDSYLSVAFAFHGGFSKGTADVSARDVKKLTPLLKHYAKMEHPFAACVRDNRKRFGKKTEAYCAVLKDLIKGTTKWRSSERKAHLSEEVEAFAFDFSEDFLAWFDDLTPSDISEMLEDASPCDIVVGDNVDLADEPTAELYAEMFFADASVKQEDGLFWKPFLREGTWNVSPGARGHQPITIIKDGVSDPHNKVISMAELKQNFEAGVVEHVTVPTSHRDSVLENTGFVKGLRYGTDEAGRATLEAALDFTEPEVRAKAERGTIANTSGGILFDYPHKESGKKYTAVLQHVALTNHPWLNGLKPFGVAMADDVNVVSFSEEIEEDTHEDVSETTPDSLEGGDTVSDTDTPTTFLTELGLSEEEVRSRLARFDSLEKETKKNRVDQKITAWEGEGKSPAVLTEARAILMSDDGAIALNLSEDGQAVSLSASDIVERLVAKMPSIKLSDDVVNDKDVSDDRPDDDATGENEGAKLSQDERALAFQLFTEEGLTEAQAVAEAKNRLMAATK